MIRPYQNAAESTVAVSASPEEVFAYLDDQANLGRHMEKPSAMMLGSSMRYVFDAALGRQAGSVIRMEGRVLGLPIGVEEKVVEYLPPLKKTWQTFGKTRLIVMGAYRMGFEVAPSTDGSGLRVFIEYNLPDGLVGRALGRLLSGFYARWCVGQMSADAAERFSGQRRYVIP